MHERSARVGTVTGRRPVSDSMVRNPKTLPITTTVGEIRRAFGSGHVHMVLLVHRGMLITTVERDDIGEEMADHSAAGGIGQLAGRTIGPDIHAEAALRYMKAAARRRLAVVDEAGRLLGLLCLKRSGTGFCSDRDVMARAAESQAKVRGDIDSQRYASAGR